RPPASPRCPYTALFRSLELRLDAEAGPVWVDRGGFHPGEVDVIWHRRWNHTRAYARTPLLNTLARSRSPNLVELASAFHLARELDRKSTRLNSSHVKIS